MTIGDRLSIAVFNTAHRWIGEAAGTDLLARELADRGHRVRMVVPNRGWLSKNLRETTYPIMRVPWRLAGGRGANRPRQYRAVARFLRKFRPDIIHVGRGKEHWCVALVRPFATPSSRIVRTRHVVLPMKQSVANRWLFRRCTDGVTAVSQAAFSGLGDLGDWLPDSRRRVVLGAVDTTRFRPDRRDPELRASLGAPGDEILIGCLGRWQRIKGHDIFLPAVARVAARHPNVRVVVAGRKITLDHPRQRELHQQSGLGDRAHFLGMLDDAAPLVASLDIGVIASRGSEGFSRIAAEYAASRVAIVATRVGALPEIFDDGETGLLVPPENVDAMEEALERAVADVELRRRLTDQAHERLVPMFSPARMAEEIEALYYETLAAR
ncbi:glycosyltransferase family 4 protein [bacterium]|nr:glycosyltransferase family 4 protein [bacterium]